MHSINERSNKDTYIRTFMAKAVKSDSIKGFFSISPIYIFHPESKALRELGPYEAIAFRGDSVFMVSRKIGFNEFIRGENQTIKSDTSALHLLKLFLSLHHYGPERVIKFYDKVVEPNDLLDPPRIKKKGNYFEVRIDYLVSVSRLENYLYRADYIVQKNGVIEGYYHSLIHVR